ncbi:DUF262 domain-containing protein [Sphingobacterium sp. SGG-5]|uniref:DUF262 domain-containing protein n=1 Tax=Sphingobacterium sp. SGG-5 TaxID=2710881 RepID=UPI0013E9F8CC|nr:DUF262 domain-containing protein [Sphingobacterium sp. SGG-5]NGM60476.1 DUF262 domain-containing protein [Sphingobacterium sp. SGG-5]
MENKLVSSIQSNSYKIVELYNKLDLGTLVPDPAFQRNLVWKKQHKYAFIQTILLNYPFPEVYIASEQIDVESLKAKEIVVDGQQRLTTIVEYIKGEGDFNGRLPIKKFDELSIPEKKDFLNYPVSVKDLKDLDEETIKQIFKRINSTNYSLNSNEILNAEFGGGEFAYFAKQLTDASLEVSKLVTDVIINPDDRERILKFFMDNKIFSDNDIKRMFDSQYIMLIASTILNGSYFRRSDKVEQYLAEYNDEFANYQTILSKILNSIQILERLNLDEKSYWFNKANLFTLIIELKDVDPIALDLDVFETALLDLEKKFDIYFSADDEEDLKSITDDERKYFEVARQGSHEQPAREHRGKVIREIIERAILEEEPNIVQQNRERLEQQGINYATIIPTETGLNKGIMDATSTVREFLKRNDVHDYDAQDNGPDHKVKKGGFFVESDGRESLTEISMYKSNGRGDCRIWFSGLKDFAEPKDELAIYVANEIVKVLNLNK